MPWSSFEWVFLFFLQKERKKCFRANSCCSSQVVVGPEIRRILQPHHQVNLMVPIKRWSKVSYCRLFD